MDLEPVGKIFDAIADDDNPYVILLNEQLDQAEVERDALIMRLRQVEKFLIKYGRLKGESIPRRQR